MRSPLAALTWEIWRRGRRSACLALASILVCALVSLLVPASLRAAESAREIFNTLFGFLMAISLLLMMGIFNYTEFNSSREWNGFPYRLFTLPVRTWQLVTWPMLLGVVSVELVFFAWIKLVWPPGTILMPEWFATVLGAYMIFYQTALWSLAGFRILRLFILGFGGVSSVAVACLPMFAYLFPSPWFEEKRLIFLLLALSAITFVLAWLTVARQRSGGGQRRNWLKTLAGRFTDIVPRRTRDFSSPAAAQFWFEWRRSGLILPASTAFVLLVIFAPFSWVFRHDETTTVGTLVRILVVPLILSFVIGKAFIKAEFWSLDLSVPTFLATRPFSAAEIVIAKLKSAALSVGLAWLLVLGFLALWLPLWADTTQLNRELFIFRWLYPHSWPVITALFLIVLAALTWRCLVTGLWVGLSGKRSWYIAAASLQVIIPSVLLLLFALFSNAINAQIKLHHASTESWQIFILGWLLALLVIVKFWFAAFSWRKIPPHHIRQYLLVWSAATLGFVTLAMLCRLWVDMFRLERLFVLVALLLFPFARLGLAPSSLARNRHR